jgi:hypothetical protein
MLANMPLNVDRPRTAARSLTARRYADTRGEMHMSRAKVWVYQHSRIIIVLLLVLVTGVWLYFMRGSSGFAIPSFLLADGHRRWKSPRE